MQIFNYRLSWICVHLGRPSSFNGVHIAIPLPIDPFFLALVRLSIIMNKCSNEIYIPNKGSLVPMWKTAMSLKFELHNYENNVIATLGFGLHHRSQLGDLDVRQTILTTCSWLILCYVKFLKACFNTRSQCIYISSSLSFDHSSSSAGNGRLSKSVLDLVMMVIVPISLGSIKRAITRSMPRNG